MSRAFAAVFTPAFGTLLSVSASCLQTPSRDFYIHRSISGPRLACAPVRVHGLSLVASFFSRGDGCRRGRALLGGRDPGGCASGGDCLSGTAFQGPLATRRDCQLPEVPRAGPRARLCEVPGVPQADRRADRREEGCSPRCPRDLRRVPRRTPRARRGSPAARHQAFNHAAETGFTLDGRHAPLSRDCARCHKTRSFLNARAGVRLVP